METIETEYNKMVKLVKNKRLSEKDIDEIFNLFHRGVPTKSIARRLDLHINTVRAKLRTLYDLNSLRNRVY